MDSTKTILVFNITTCSQQATHALMHRISFYSLSFYFLRGFLALGGVERILICSRWNSSLWWRSSLSIFLVYFLLTGNTNSTTWSPSIRLFISMKMSFGTTNLDKIIYTKGYFNKI